MEATMKNLRIGRIILAAMFWICGAFGLLGNTVNFMNATRQASVDPATSAYITMGCIYWIGWMVLFGIGALLAGTYTKSV
jgi:hypothetical protein